MKFVTPNQHARSLFFSVVTLEKMNEFPQYKRFDFLWFLIFRPCRLNSKWIMVTFYATNLFASPLWLRNNSPIHSLFIHRKSFLSFLYNWRHKGGMIKVLINKDNIQLSLVEYVPSGRIVFEDFHRLFKGFFLAFSLSCSLLYEQNLSVLSIIPISGESQSVNYIFLKQKKIL